MASNGPPPASSSSSSSRLNPSTYAPPHLRASSPAGGTATPQLTTGSATQTITSTPTGAGSPLRASVSPDRDGAGPHLVLRLRGAATRMAQTEVEGEEQGMENVQEEVGGRRGIRWAEDVVDNEGLGRKSSKVCCIYHKPRAVGESSSEEDSSDSDSDSGSDGGGSDSLDDGGARMVGGGRGRKSASSKGKGKGKARGHGHGHEHGEDCGHGHGDAGGAKRKRRPSPNAYEKMPSYGKKS